MSAKVSVIIPVYNTEKYLRKCIESVCNQTLFDIEIICVNDCSPDGCLAILQEYAQKDSRIKIIDFKENKGVSVARNTGIDEAIGEYIGFVDSDDFIDLDFYEKLYNKAVETGAEAVKGNICKVDNNDEYKILADLHKKIHYNRIYFHCMFTTAIYKNSFLKDNNIKFIEESGLGEDRLLPVMVSVLAKDFKIINNTFYYYCSRINSATYNSTTPEKIYEKAISIRYIIDFCNDAENLSISNYKIVIEEFLDALLSPILYEYSYGRVDYNLNLIKDIFDNIKHKDCINEEYQKVVYPFLCDNNFEKYKSRKKAFDQSKFLKTLKSNVKKYKISVIIPIFNAEDYLERCLNSVVNQTLKGIEIICVNDCSTDQSINILREYEKKYKNLKVIDCKENGGESTARNKGLEIATGDYLGFVDNDDEIDLDFYEKLYNKAIETNACIVKGRMREINYDGKESFCDLNSKIRKNNSNLFFAYYWWTGIYKNSLIKKNNIKFIENYPLGGDILFLNEAILSCDKLELVDDTFYHYYRREDSGFSKYLSIEKIKSALIIHNKILENVNNLSYEDTGITFINLWCIRTSLSYMFRCKTIECLKFCIKITFIMYSKIKNKNIFNEIFIKELPCQADFLINSKEDDMLDFYKKNDTQKKMFMANLRYKMKGNK